jgi:hypothetical protein
MSVFRVKLNNVDQGRLDLDPSTHPGSPANYGNLGNAFAVSKQRQIYVMGPKHVNRLLKDGDTFSDCNYWKRFAYPQVPLNQAIVEVVTDDGSVYSDVESENTFVVGKSFGSVADAYNTDNTLNFVTTYGSPAKFFQITNTHGSYALTVELNGDTNATITLAAGDAQIFNSGDLAITQIRVKSATTGGKAEVVASVKSAVRS